MPLPLLAIGAAAAGSGILGGLTKKKSRNQYASPELSNAYKAYIDRLGGDQPAYDKALAASDAANQARIADIAGISKENRADINNYLSYLSGAESDPYGITKRVTEDRLGYLRDFADDLGAQGRRQQNIALGQLNYSGGRGGSFVDSARQNRISSNLAPAFSGILAGATPTATAIQQGRLANVGAGLGLLQGRLDTANYGKGLEMTPVSDLALARGTELGLMGQLGQNINANIKGVREDQNWAGQAGSGLNSAINTFTSLYGMGALSGMGKGATPAASSSLPATGNYGQFAQMAYNTPISQPPPYYGQFTYAPQAQPPPAYFGQFGYNPYAQSIVQPPNQTPWYSQPPIGSSGNYLDRLKMN